MEPLSMGVVRHSHDCERAISQVQSNGSTACVAPQPNVPLALETSNFTPLVTVGTCQLALEELLETACQLPKWQSMPQIWQMHVQTCR